MPSPPLIARPARSSAPRRGSSRGAWTIVGIFALGLTVAAGLFLAPTAVSPTAPPGLPLGFPDRPLRLIFYDFDAADRNPDQAVAELKELAAGPTAADILCASGIEADAVPLLATALDMRASYFPQLFQRLPRLPGSAETTGVCILSRYPLYDARGLRVDRHKGFGVAAVVVAGGRKFEVVCLRPASLSADDAKQYMVDAVRREAAAAPLLAVGTFDPQLESELMRVAGLVRVGSLPDTLPSQGGQLRIIGSPGWMAGNVRPIPGESQRPRGIQVQLLPGIR